MIMQGVCDPLQPRLSVRPWLVEGFAPLRPLPFRSATVRLVRRGHLPPACLLNHGKAFRQTKPPYAAL